ncbi:gliding motility-associated protein GldL [Bacteroidales bacterium KA00344]|nr:gliding motility-associated protein GldL [Bacteroidales bacterium KA00344]
MSNYSKYNLVYRLQKWIDTVAGQTFLNYAYSWGASVVILGALFKLTHLPGANIMLFIGMGTEVAVFFISAFDRPFDKTADGREIPIRVTEEYLESGTVTYSTGSDGAAPKDSNVVVATAGQSSAESPIGSQPGGTSVQAAMSASNYVPQMSAEEAEVLNEAQSNYVDELNKLVETLEKVNAQSSRLTRDSEEMENLNRTLTGISKVYEMQLKGASQQIGTIDQINEQSRRMAQQIEKLNRIYARMIEAMTVNMPMGAPKATPEPSAPQGSQGNDQ